MIILWQWNVRDDMTISPCDWIMWRSAGVCGRRSYHCCSLGDSTDHRRPIRQMSKAGHWLIRPKLGLTKLETLLCRKGKPLSPKMNAQDYIAKIFDVAVALLLHSWKTFFPFPLFFPRPLKNSFLLCYKLMIGKIDLFVTVADREFRNAYL